MRKLLIALSFLTRVPIKLKPVGKELSGAMLYFPAVGLFIGCTLAAVQYAASIIFPGVIVSILVIIVLVLLTGALHLDGFADTCDGFYAGQYKDDVLRIMSDSHIGTMGVVGLICLLLAKFSLIISIPSLYIRYALILMPVISRWSMVVSAVSAPYAKQEGTARGFLEDVGLKELIGTTVFTLICAYVLLHLKPKTSFNQDEYTLLSHLEYVL